MTDVFKDLWSTPDQKILHEKITAAVAGTPPAAVPASASVEEYPEIPEFLRRLPGNKINSAPVPAGSPLPSRKSEAAPKAEPPSTQPPAPSFDEQQQIKKSNTFKRLRARAAAKDAIAEGLVLRNGKFVRHDSLTRANYNRILAELPTPNMKRLFVHMFSEKVL